MRLHAAYLLACIQIGLFTPLPIISEAIAAEVPLFTADGEPVPRYQEILTNELRPGDVVVFAGGEKFTLDSKLGCGAMTCVYALQGQPKLVLRIPQLKESSPEGAAALAKNLRKAGVSEENIKKQLRPRISNSVEDLVNGEQRLKEAGVPIIHIHEFKNKQYAVVDRIESRYELKHFLFNPFEYDKNTRKKLEKGLLSFARKTASLGWIGDFHEGQVHYVDGRGWVLVDWDSRHAGRMMPTRHTFLKMFVDEDESNKLMPILKSDDSHGTWLRSLAARIDAAIVEERNEGQYAACVKKHLATKGLIRRHWYEKSSN